MTAPHSEQGDPALSALLRANVDAPPLRPGFHEELEARLQTAAVPVTTVPARRRQVRPLRLLAAASVAAAAAIFVFAVLPALRGGDTATAGDVLAAMTAASGGAQTVRMHVISKSLLTQEGETTPSDRSIDTADLIMDIRGDSLAAVTSDWGWMHDDGTWTSHTASRVDGYDASLHESRTLSGARGDRGKSSIRRPAWQAEQAIGDFTGVYSALAAQMHAALAESDPSMPVQETTHLGRPAWRCAFTVQERWGIDRELLMTFHWDATVDQATGLLVAASLAVDSNGEKAPWTWELRVTRLETDPTLQPDWQLPDTQGTKVTIVDEGTRFGTPEAVAARSWPTLPLIPQWAPAGYRRTDVASAGFAPGDGVSAMWSARQSKTRVVAKKGGVTFRRAEWPLEDQAVLVRFRRGFSSFTVQITPKPFGMGVGGGEPDVTLSAGYLKGKPAYFGDGGGDGVQIGIATPTLIAYSDRSQVVIRGDLTRGELIEVAESMKAYGDVDRPPMPGFGQ